MAILPLQAAGHLARGGIALAGAAVGAVSADFAGLLKAAVSPAPSSASANDSADHLLDLPGTAGLRRPHGGADRSELRRQSETLTENFRERLLELLAEKGVELAGPVHLRLDALGQIEVAGRHPQMREIERLLETHSDLADLFRTIAAHSRRLDAADLSETAGPSPTFDLLISRDRAVPSFIAE